MPQLLDMKSKTYHYHKAQTELASLRKVNEEVAGLLGTCHSAIKSLPADALGQDREIGHYYRDELLAKIEAARQSTAKNSQIETIGRSETPVENLEDGKAT